MLRQSEDAIPENAKSNINIEQIFKDNPAVALMTEDKIALLLDEIYAGKSSEDQEVYNENKKEYIDALAELKKNFRSGISGKSRHDIYNSLLETFPTLRFDEKLTQYYINELFMAPEEVAVEKLYDEDPTLFDRLPDMSFMLEYDDEAIKKYVERNFEGDRTKLDDITKRLIAWRNFVTAERWPSSIKTQKELARAEVREIKEVGSKTYASILDGLEEYFNKPSWAILPEEIDAVLRDATLLEGILKKIDETLMRYEIAQADIERKKQPSERVSSPKRAPIAIPNMEELRSALNKVLEEGGKGDTEERRQYAAKIRGDLLKDFDIPTKYSPALMEHLEHAPGDTLNIIAGDIGKPVYLQYPFLVYTEPGKSGGEGIYSFRLGRYTKDLNEKYGAVKEVSKPNILRDNVIEYMVSQGFPEPDTNDTYHFVGKSEINKFMDVLRSYMQRLTSSTTFNSTLQRVAKYFSLFKEFDVAGGSWVLDEGVKKIMRKTKDTSEVIKEGGYWEFKEGESLYRDSDIGPVAVTVLAKLPERNYRIKDAYGNEQEVNEDRLFSLDNII